MYWIAFSDLSTERSIGMALGPIPHSKIVAYAARLGMFGDEADFFIGVIRQIDADYLRLINASSKHKGRHVEEVSAQDIEGSKQVMNRLRARAGGRKGNGNP